MSTTAETATDQVYNTWEAILAFLDTPSSDGRMLAADGMSVRPLPLTLSFMPATDDGHDGSYPVGRIDKVWVDGAKVMGSGVWDSTAEAQDAARMVDEQIQYEISIDPTLQEYTQRFPLDWQEEIVETEDGEEAIEITESVDDYMMTYTKWELAGATIVNGAAFGETEISVTSAGQPAPPALMFKGSMITANGKPFASDPDDDEGDSTGAVSMIALYPAPEEAQSLFTGQDGDEAAPDLHLTLAVFTGEVPDADLITALLSDFASTQPPLAGDVTGVGVFAGGGTDPVPVIALADVLGLADLRTDLCDVLEAAAIPYATDHDFVPHVTLGYRAGGVVAASSDDPAIAKPLTFGAISYVTQAGDRFDYSLSAIEEADEAVTASAVGRAPDNPPLSWFEAPIFDEPTPMEFSDDGQVLGHAALFGVCHTGINGRCLTLDRLRSGTNYAYFHTGYLVTAEGEKVRVGQITIGTTHPSLAVRDVQQVAEHYSHTGTVAADVVVGEDEFGLWVAGALRPDFPASRIRELRAATLSGDWRPIHRSAELMALLAVNVPGYPVIAPEALAASGEPDDAPLLGGVGVGIILPGSIHPAEPSEARLAALRAAAGGLPALREAAGL